MQTAGVWFVAFVFLLSVQAARVDGQRTRTYDVQSYEIHTSFDRQHKIIFGDTTIRLKPLNPNFNQLALDSAGMKFEFVRLAADGRNLEYRQTGERLLIFLDRVYSSEEEIAVRLKYSAKPKKGVYFVEASTILDRIKRPAQVWTQGEPEENRYWFPSYDFPDDKATSEQFITVGSDEIADANGDLISVTKNNDGTKTFHFKTSFPHSSYLTSFVVGAYVVISDNSAPLPISFLLYPGTEEFVPLVFRRTREMMRTFEELTQTQFPFGKYDQVVIGGAKFGGMENVTATTLADTDIFNAYRIPLQVEDLVAHELAHSWFGNLVTCRNWSELWLNEGFATFMEAAYRERIYGRGEYLRKIREDARKFLNEGKNRVNHPLYNPDAKPDQSLFNSINYEKGGVVLHMLREEIGDKAFWSGVRLFLTRHRFDTVTSEDLRKAMEESSGEDLQSFFSQWVYGKGIPELQLHHTFNSTLLEFTLSIDQRQKSKTGGATAFQFPLELTIVTAAGIRHERIEIKTRREILKLKLSEAPTEIKIDSGEKIPLKSVQINRLKNTR